MKTRKILLMVALMVATVAVNAQSRNNGQSQKSERQTSQHNHNSKGNVSEQRTVTVQSQPAKTLNKVNRSQVTYRTETPKVVAFRNQNQPIPQVVNHDNKDYYVQSGVYYRKYNDNFIKVAPPVGLSVSILPQGSLKVVIGNRNYFYFEGTYYEPSGNGYVVDTPPVGAIVYALPADYERVEVDGQSYYEYNGILYTKIIYQSERAYQVVGYLN